MAKNNVELSVSASLVAGAQKVVSTIKLPSGFGYNPQGKEVVLYSSFRVQSHTPTYADVVSYLESVAETDANKDAKTVFKVTPPKTGSEGTVQISLSLSYTAEGLAKKLRELAHRFGEKVKPVKDSKDSKDKNPPTPDKKEENPPTPKTSAA